VEQAKQPQTDIDVDIQDVPESNIPEIELDLMNELE
jgi:hypothetical protein